MRLFLLAAVIGVSLGVAAAQQEPYPGQRDQASGRTSASSHLFGRESFIQPATNGPHSYAKRFGEGGSRHHLAVNFDKPVVTLISSLLNSGGPSAVLWRIGAIVINSVQGATREPRSHVSQECLEAIFPTGADGNSTATVSGIAAMVRIQAPLPHPTPRFVLWRPVHSMGATQAAGDRLGAETATTSRAASSQVGASGIGKLPAVATTSPFLVAILVVDHDESAESLAGNVYQWASHPANFSAKL